MGPCYHEHRTLCRKGTLNCTHCPSCHQQHRVNSSDLRLTRFSSSGHVCFPGGPSGEAVVCELLQPPCHSLSRTWGLVIPCLCRSFGHAINTIFSFTIRNGILETQCWEECSTLSAQVIIIILTLLFFPHSLTGLQFRLHFSLNISVTNLLHTYFWDNHCALSPSDNQ